MFKKILIANRGEIAIRVIRSCKEMGITTVAVYSDADRRSLHVRIADEAYHIGESSSAQSYLRMDKIIEAAKKSNAEAIHPGYGFLSENAEFTEACNKAGIKFIGPDAYAISTMGDKITARKKMIEAGVSVVPGTKGEMRDNATILKSAKEIGYPVMVKASAGGGGKGMRLVKSEEEIINAVKMAKSEAKSAFGNDAVYLEKFVNSPHHIEFQVLADKFGNTIHINERECSVQRRHQKVVEETPSPLMTAALRQKMGAEAVAAAKAVNYEGAGTVEFLVDNDLNYYFLEMNTRLQVEHPVTEQTTGIDLVKEQIRIAYGEKLSLKQEDVILFGHSMECRIYAEDAENNFMPSPGKIKYVKEPAGIGVRNDGYIYKGFEIPIHYDPMISKLIVWGKDRQEAINRMKRALCEYRIIGVKTSIRFLMKIFENKEFIAGNYNTQFIETYSEELFSGATCENEDIENISAITVFLEYLDQVSLHSSTINTQQINKWKDYGRRKGIGN